MTLKSLLGASLVLVLGAGAAGAQNVLMNSAETINQGNFKISAFPTLLIGDDGDDSEFGLASRFGYGFTEYLDVEGKLGLFDDVTYYGLDAEVGLLRGRDIDASVALGVSKTDVDAGFDSTAIDTALLVSGHVGRDLELYGGVNVSFASLDDIDDSDFTRAYLVPGLEYKVRENIDVLAEFGVGLNDNSSNYFSFGVALYLR